MSKTYVKRSPKATNLGLKAQYRILADGDTELWVTDEQGQVVYQRKATTPDGAFSRFYSFLNKYEAEQLTANLREAMKNPKVEIFEPSPPANMAELIAALDRLVLRLDALLDRADAIFAHADKVLQELA